MRGALPDWLSTPAPGDATPRPEAEGGATHLERAIGSLRDLLDDPHVPPRVRAALADEFQQVEVMLDKLEHGHLHIAVFGRVGVGKSSLLNALLGERRFSTSPLHGETRVASMSAWQEIDTGGVYLVDTPGISEVDGEARERLAHEVAGRADLVLFVVEGDISNTELGALRRLVDEQRPVLLVLNKADRYRREDRERIIEALRGRCEGLISPEHVVAASADPAERIYVEVTGDGSEREEVRRPASDIQALRERLWEVLEHEGKTLAALNATLFAGRVSDVLGARILETQRSLADGLVRNYCLTKGVLVGFNPIPVADLLAAAGLDVALVAHLSRIYGLPVDRREAGDLVKTIAGQVAVVMGTVWIVNLVSSALKGGTLGLSTVITAAAQGAVAYYATWIVGEAAHRYFRQGKSWGEKGPKRVVSEILESIDRDSFLAEARQQILLRLRAG